MFFITLTGESFDSFSGQITDLSVAYNVAKPGCVLEMSNGHAHLVRESLAEVLSLIDEE